MSTMSYSILYKSHLNYFFSPASYLYMSADYTACAVAEEGARTCMRKVSREDDKGGKERSGRENAWSGEERERV